MKKIIPFLTFIMLLMTACGADAPAQTPLPTEPALIGAVKIESPSLGAVIYAEAIYVSGSAQGTDDFRLQIETAEGISIFDGIVTAIQGHWVREVLHSYTDDPTELVIRALATDKRVSLQYDEVVVLLAPLEFRPEGIFAIILSPLANMAVGGDALEVSGTASGIPDGRLTLILRNDKEMLDKQVIVQFNPYVIDERTWSADLLTNGYTGTATIDLSYHDPESDSDVLLDSISIIIGSAAG